MRLLFRLESIIFFFCFYTFNLTCGDVYVELCILNYCFRVLYCEFVIGSMLFASVTVVVAENGVLLFMKQVLQLRQGTASGGLTIKELNDLLDQLSSSENRFTVLALIVSPLCYLFAMLVRPLLFLLCAVLLCAVVFVCLRS